MGEGSMGAVFRAEQLSLRRPVAVKLLTPRRALDQRHLQRFLREARAVAKLNHPNIVSGIDVGESRGFRYFAEETNTGVHNPQRGAFGRRQDGGRLDQRLGL